MQRAMDTTEQCNAVLEQKNPLSLSSLCLSGQMCAYDTFHTLSAAQWTWLQSLLGKILAEKVLATK